MTTIPSALVVFSLTFSLPKSWCECLPGSSVQMRGAVSHVRAGVRRLGGSAELTINRDPARTPVRSPRELLNFGACLVDMHEQ